MLKDSCFKEDNKRELVLLKKPIYDVLGYTISITSKMTTFARPDQIVIGQLVYESLDKVQKSVFKKLTIGTGVRNYISNSTGGRIYDLYGNILEKGQV